MFYSDLMKAQKPGHNSIVAKGNELIGHMAKYELSELRLIAYCLAHYDSRKDDDRTITATVDDLKNLFKMTTKDAYGVVRQAVRAVNRKPFAIETDRTEEEWYIFTGFRYYKNEGYFEFKISPEAQPFLLELKGNFTRYRLGDVYQFRAASTWKLYELLKRWLSAGRWEIELDELHLMLGVAGKYPRWSNFRQWVIDPATAEINDLSDITVEYHQEKRGRRVIGLVFKVRSKRKDDADVIDLESPEDELHRRLLAVGISAQTAAEYARDINRQGKASRIIAKLPAMIERAKQRKGIAAAESVLGEIRGELGQGDLLEFAHSVANRHQTTRLPDPDYKPALDCWHEYRRQKKQCPIRNGSKTPKEETCLLCLERIKWELFGS